MSENHLKHPAQTDPPAEARHTLDTLDGRLLELERENTRLQRLVSELLLRNQQLRCAS